MPVYNAITPYKHHGRYAFATHVQQPIKNPSFDETVDVLIIGSGAGALTTALRARTLGFQAVVIEKQKTIGGASVLSGGALWIPCNPVSVAAGIQDSKDDALRYFEAAVGDVGPASSLAKREAFLDEGPKAIAFLLEQGFCFHSINGYPDYYPLMAGGKPEGGRNIESIPWDTRKLKERVALLPEQVFPLALRTDNANKFAQMAASPRAFLDATREAIPLIARGLMGQKLTSMGRGLVAQLLYLNDKQQQTDIRMNTAFSQLIQAPDGRVVGAEIKDAQGNTKAIQASRGVVLAAGGFAHNKQLREKYMPQPVSTSWTSAPEGDTGDAVIAGMKLGAATALLDDAWWGPTIMDPVTSRPTFNLYERSFPHTIVVDASGARFFNEAESYTDAGHAQYARNKIVKAIPAWQILDTNHRNKYIFGGLMPRAKPPQEAFDNGNLFVANSLSELATQIGVDAHGLETTVQNYNDMCKDGVDRDFGKGDNAYNTFFGDRATKPNPNMGPIVKPPFYASQIWPGDLGTKGGLLTDTEQRVLDKTGKPIAGLFAIGNTAASIMGRTYLGAGSTLGPAVTHGYIVANTMASRS